MNYNHKKGKPKSKTPNNPNGVRAMRRDDFIQAYEWQLELYGDNSHKIVTTLPLIEYYYIGLDCIDSGITIAEFIRQAIRAKKGDIKKIGSKVNKNNIHENQGVLF